MQTENIFKSFEGLKDYNATECESGAGCVLSDMVEWGKINDQSNRTDWER